MSSASNLRLPDSPVPVSHTVFATTQGVFLAVLAEPGRQPIQAAELRDGLVLIRRADDGVEALDLSDSPHLARITEASNADGVLLLILVDMPTASTTVGDLAVDDAIRVKAARTSMRAHAPGGPEVRG